MSDTTRKRTRLVLNNNGYFASGTLVGGWVADRSKRNPGRTNAPAESVSRHSAPSSRLRTASKPSPD